MDIAALSQPLSAEEPAGPDLSYDPVRQTIEQAFNGAPDEVDWPRTIELIEEQAAVTRDTWLPVYLARAGARAGDLAAVEGGAALLAGLFEQLWPHVHPTLEEYGVEGRKGACESLVRIGEFLGPLRRVPLIAHPRLGSFSGADLERFAEEGVAAEGYGQFRAAVADTDPAVIGETVDRLRRIVDDFGRADAVLSEEAGALGHTGTNFQPTYGALNAIIEALAPHAGLAAAPDSSSVDGVSDAGMHGGSGVAAAHSGGAIASRADVARTLDAVIAYYARAEPSSPIPVALLRIKGWIELDFMAILSDISPGSLADAINVLQARNEGVGSPDMM